MITMDFRSYRQIRRWFHRGMGYPRRYAQMLAAAADTAGGVQYRDNRGGLWQMNRAAFGRGFTATRIA